MERRLLTTQMNFVQSEFLSLSHQMERDVVMLTWHSCLYKKCHLNGVSKPHNTYIHPLCYKHTYILSIVLKSPLDPVTDQG